MDHKKIISAFKLKKARLVVDNIMSRCPFGTHDDNHPSFGINIFTGDWNCLTCGEKGRGIRTLAFALKILLPDDLMMESLRIVSNKSNSLEEAYEYSFTDIPDFNPNKKAKELKMIMRRGVSLAALEYFNVGTNSSGGVIFPCIDIKGKLRGWIERNDSWDGRYGFRPTGVNRRELLFGLTEEGMSDVFLVEGPVDMLKLSSWGYNAVATCGNIIFKEQATKLTTYCKNIILVPDRDAGGDKWLKDAEMRLKGGVDLKIVYIPEEYKDVGNSNFELTDFEDSLSEISSF